MMGSWTIFGWRICCAATRPAPLSISILVCTTRGRSFSWRYGDKEVWRLGRDELVEIYAGFEIANHSLNHPNLPDLSPRICGVRCKTADASCKSGFSSRCVVLLPFGGFNPMVKEAVRAGQRLRPHRDRTRTDIAVDRSIRVLGQLPVRRSLVLDSLQACQGIGWRVLLLGPQLRTGREAMWADLEDQIADRRRSGGGMGEHRSIVLNGSSLVRAQP